MHRQKIQVSGLVLVTLPAGEHLNDKVIEELATTLKVEPKKLQEQLVTKEADPTKMESKVKDILSPDVMILQKPEYEEALDRKGKTKYDEGRFAEREMTVKQLKREHGITDDNVKDINAFLSKYGEKVKTEAGVAPDKQVEALRKEKEALQKLAEQKDAEIGQLKNQFNTEKQASVVHSQINSAINGVDIDIADEKVPAQRKMLMNAFMQDYDFKLEDGKTIVYEKGTDKKITDALLKPVSIEDVLKDYAPKYVNIKTPTGRGDKANPGSTLTGDLAKIKDKASFIAYLTGQGITDLYSEKAQAILTEVKAKNPNFKLI